MILRRVSHTAVEGRFTCRIPGDSNSPTGLLILHPSEFCVTIDTLIHTFQALLYSCHLFLFFVCTLVVLLCNNLWPYERISDNHVNLFMPVNSITGKFEVVSRNNNTFKVTCTSTGGGVLNMSVTGPDFYSHLSNIKAVDTVMRMGNDTFSGTTQTLTASYGEIYNCTASNGVSVLTKSIEVKGNILLNRAHVWV